MVFCIFGEYMGKPYSNHYLDSLIGTKRNKLTILEHFKENKCNYFKCLCECGRIAKIRANHLLNDNQYSCGKHHKKYLDSKIGERLYNTWNRMIHRCYDVSNHKYPSYGGRGILVCEDWRNNYDSFYKWALENGYCFGLWIERIDNNGNYCPENCKWATRTEQMRNTRRTHLIDYNGTRKSLAEWCEILNLYYPTINSRINKGWDAARAFETPTKRGFEGTR